MADNINLETATAAELRAWKKQIDWDDAPPGALDQLNDLIIERMVEERVSGGLAAATATSKAQQQDDLAIKRWPELKNKESDFYKRTMELIPEEDRGKPGKLLAAANEAGLQVYGSPLGKTPPQHIASGRSADADVGGGGGVDEAGFLKRTTRLRELLEGEGLLKSTPEVMQRIVASAKAENTREED